MSHLEQCSGSGQHGKVQHMVSQHLHQPVKWEYHEVSVRTFTERSLKERILVSKLLLGYLAISSTPSLLVHPFVQILRRFQCSVHQWNKDLVPEFTNADEYYY